MATDEGDKTSEVTPERQLDRLWGYLKGFHAVHLAATGIDLGLFEGLHRLGGATPVGLASDLGLHPPYVDVWCKTAFAYGLLEDGGDGRFVLGPYYDQILVQVGHPRYLAPFFTGKTTFYAEDFRRYSDFFRSGDTHTYQAHGEEFSHGIAAMTAGFHVVVARKLLPSIPGVKETLDAGGSILDMGCGAGNLLIQIAKAFPEATCVGVDVDRHGIEAAQKAIAAEGLGDRCRAELLSGDEIAHRDAFDVVTMFEVLHEIPEAVRPSVIRNCHKALKPGAPLYIVDETYPSNLDELRDPSFNFAIQTGYNELIWGNVVPTRADQDALLAEAGFEKVERTMIANMFTAITAWKG